MEKINKTRSIFDIIYGILEHCYMISEDKTLMDKYGFTLEQFNRYKAFLIGVGLLKTSQEGLEITGKGKKFLRDYLEIRNNLNSSGHL